MRNGTKPTDSFRVLLALAALVYAVFVFYGSLVPFDYKPLLWSEALARFNAIPFLALGVGSRADWVANLILYIPVGFLLMGALGGRSVALVMWTTSVVASGLLVIGLSLAIEFVQVFYPPRTVSLNDLYAEWMGGSLGILLWLLTGLNFLKLLTRFSQGSVQAVQATLIAYALIYLFLSLYPYDFLLSVQEWRTHLSQNKAAWLFVGSCGWECGAKLIPEIIATLPLGLLLVRNSGRITWLSVIGVGAILGITIEILQLGLASGTSQGASVLTRAAGVTLGASLPGLFRHWKSRQMRQWVRTGIVVAGIPYLSVIAALNHWFDAPWMRIEDAFNRYAEIRFIPFYYHYYTSEAVALVSLIFQFGLYAPGGAAVWLWYQSKGLPGISPWFSALLGMLIATVMEVGKLFVMGQHPDPTNILIGATAAGSCHALLMYLFSPTPRVAIPRVNVFSAYKTEATQTTHSTTIETTKLPPARFAALGLLIGVAWSLIGYPREGLFLFLLVLGAMAAVCWRWQGSWLIVVPATLPVLDFSNLSGRLFWSEFDTLLLLILAITYVRSRNSASLTLPGRIPLALYVIATLISLGVGLFPLAPFDGNAFTHYTSSYNALRMIKGLLFALAFVPLLKGEWQQDRNRFTARLALGMTLGLTLELVHVMWERATYSGLWNFDTDFRITGSFPGMHIGGASIEAYLVLAAPFVWLWAWPRRRASMLLMAGVLYALAAYGVMVTFSRGGQIAFAISSLLTLAGFGLMVWKTRNHGVSGMAVLFVSILAAGLVAWPIISGKFSQARLANIQADMGIRTAHWQDALNILSQAGNPIVGVGLGTFPSAFYWYSGTPTRPATYAFLEENHNVFLRLGGGESLYFEQGVSVSPTHTYRLSMDVRSSAKSAALTVPLCEKALLYSFTCEWKTLQIQGEPKQWQHQEIEVKTDGFGPPGSLLQRPVKLSMFNQDKNIVIDVDNVVLRDKNGVNLVRNGDFSKGMQAWYFSTDSHLAWHAKNLFIHVLFEQGGLGLGAFVMLLAAVGWTLLKRSFHDALALSLFVSLTAFLIVGLVDSLIDEPRLNFLFLWLMMIALVSGSKALHPFRAPRVGRMRQVASN